MGTGNSGRSTTGGPAVPYYPGTFVQEAAKHLRLTTARFIAERVPFSDVEREMATLRQAVEAAKAGRK